MSRILGIDYGEKRIGIAISDELGIIAHSFTTLNNKGERYVVDEITKICNNEGVEKIIVGIPRSMNGEERKRAKEVIEFVDFLKQNIRQPILIEDERLTTKIAEKSLAEYGIKAKDKREKVDQIAAQIILQGYLDKIKGY